MKKIVIFTVIIVALTLLAGCTFISGKKVVGSGVCQTKTVVLSDFNEVKASRGVKVIISDSVKDEALIKADDNIIDFVFVKIEDGKLKAGIDDSVRSLDRITVEITIPNNGKIRGLKVSSTATIISEPVLVSKKMYIDASSSGRIKAGVRAVKCDVEASSASAVNLGLDVAECSIDASSSAEVLLSGITGSCEMEASSASRIDAGSLTAEKADLKASSASCIEIICTSQLKAKASSASSIRYSGGCNAETYSSSAGSVSNI